MGQMTVPPLGGGMDTGGGKVIVMLFIFWARQIGEHINIPKHHTIMQQRQNDKLLQWRLGPLGSRKLRVPFMFVRLQFCQQFRKHLKICKHL